MGLNVGEQILKSDIQTIIDNVRNGLNQRGQTHTLLSVLSDLAKADEINTVVASASGIIGYSGNFEPAEVVRGEVMYSEFIKKLDQMAHDIADGLKCEASCIGVCSSCSGYCIGSCTNGCTGGCGGGCKSWPWVSCGCVGSNSGCSGACRLNCSTVCTNGCNMICTTTCKSSSSTPVGRVEGSSIEGIVSV